MVNDTIEKKKRTKRNVNTRDKIHHSSIVNPCRVHNGKEMSAYESIVAHQAGAYSGFYSMKRLGVFLFPPGWDASPSQVTPQYTPEWREAL